MNILPPPHIDEASLRNPVRRVLDAQDVTIVTWHLDTIQPQSMGTNSGIYRVSGTANDRNTMRDWSLILKVLCPPAKREDTTMRGFYDGDPATDRGSLLYWKREALVYTSGILADLPGGLSAPRCYGLHEPSADEAWLWLEEVRDAAQPPGEDIRRSKRMQLEIDRDKGLLRGILGERLGVPATIVIGACGSLPSFLWLLFSPVRHIRWMPAPVEEQ